MQAVLAEFSGTILLVSHDRYLVDALATQLWAAEPGLMRVFKGTYQEYVTARESERLAQLESSRPVKTRTALKANVTPIRKNDAAGKALSKREIERRTASLEAEIERLEAALTQITEDMDAAGATGALDKVRSLGEQYTETQAAIEAKLQEWETLYA